MVNETELVYLVLLTILMLIIHVILSLRAGTKTTSKSKTRSAN